MIEGQLSIGAARYITHSDFQEQGPLGAEMHVRIVQAARGHDGEHRRPVRFQAPAKEWETLHQWLRKECVVPPGARHALRKRSDCLLRAAASVERLMDVVGRHPAYRGLAMLGKHSEVLVAYRLGDTGRWWPSVRQARANGNWEGTLVEADLDPEIIVKNGQILTRWVPMPR